MYEINHKLISKFPGSSAAIKVTLDACGGFDSTEDIAKYIKSYCDQKTDVSYSAQYVRISLSRCLKEYKFEDTESAISRLIDVYPLLAAPRLMMIDCLSDDR